MTELRGCVIIIIIIIIIIFLQGLGQRPVPVQKFKFWTYESIWTVGRTPWRVDQPDARPLPTQDNTTQKKRGHTSMPRAGFEPANPMFERPKTVLDLDHAAIGIGVIIYNHINLTCDVASLPAMPFIHLPYAKWKKKKTKNLKCNKAEVSQFKKKKLWTCYFLLDLEITWFPYEKIFSHFQKLMMNLLFQSVSTISYTSFIII
jgi:hypothetical protein